MIRYLLYLSCSSISFPYLDLFSLFPPPSLLIFFFFHFLLLLPVSSSPTLHCLLPMFHFLPLPPPSFSFCHRDAQRPSKEGVFFTSSFVFVFSFLFFFLFFFIVFFPAGSLLVLFIIVYFF